MTCSRVTHNCWYVCINLYLIYIQDKSKLISYVVAAGLTYGQGENILHYLFKTAWHGNIEYLPVFGDGQNVIPSIHILDLAR